MTTLDTIELYAQKLGHFELAGFLMICLQKSQEAHDSDGWFSCSFEDWQKLGFGRRTVQTYRNALKRYGLEWRNRGTLKFHYRLTNVNL